jgi:hypothetical protein
MQGRGQERCPAPQGSSLCSQIQGYLAEKKTPRPLGPPQEPRHGPTEGSYGVAVSHKRGTPVLHHGRDVIAAMSRTIRCLLIPPAKAMASLRLGLRVGVLALEVS